MNIFKDISLLIIYMLLIIETTLYNHILILNKK